MLKAEWKAPPRQPTRPYRFFSEYGKDRREIMRIARFRRWLEDTAMEARMGMHPRRMLLNYVETFAELSKRGLISEEEAQGRIAALKQTMREL